MFSVIVLITFALFAGNAVAISVTPGVDHSDLVNTIVGSGVNVSSVSYSGAFRAAGTFTGGLSSGIGIDEGIVLTSGFAYNITSANTLDDITGDNNLPGNADLDGLIPGFQTFDATILEFDFTTTSGNLFFNFVFGSDECNEYVNSPYNDVFGFFLNSGNLALIPDTATPVSINNVNGGNPFGTDASNPEFYNNNDPDDPASTFDFEYDGFTDVFTARSLGLGLFGMAGLRRKFK